MSLCLFFFVETAQWQKHFDHSSLSLPWNPANLAPLLSWHFRNIESSEFIPSKPFHPSCHMWGGGHRGAGYSDLGLWPQVSRSITMMAIRPVLPGALGVVSLGHQRFLFHPLWFWRRGWKLFVADYDHLSPGLFEPRHFHFSAYVSLRVKVWEDIHSFTIWMLYKEKSCRKEMKKTIIRQVPCKCRKSLQ